MSNLKTKVINIWNKPHTEIIDPELLKKIEVIYQAENSRKIKKLTNTKELKTYLTNGDKGMIYCFRLNNLNLSVFYRELTRQLIILNFRFHQSIYELKSLMFGEILDYDGGSIFLCHCYNNISNSIQTRVVGLEFLDQLLISKYKKDLDLEIVEIRVKKFYKNVFDIKKDDWKIGILLLSNDFKNMSVYEF